MGGAGSLILSPSTSPFFAWWFEQFICAEGGSFAEDDGNEWKGESDVVGGGYVFIGF
jgi:hypothetical protein